MTTVTSYIKSRKTKAAGLKETICSLLQWTEFEYGSFQYESGIAYLRHYITHDQWGQDMLQRSRLFWNWWKVQWMNREDAYLSASNDEFKKLTVVHRRNEYAHLHNAATLASEIYPGRIILDESYNQMIHQLHKEEVHA